MQKVPQGYLRRPPGRGFMAPQVVLDLLEAVEALDGAEARAAVEREAELFRIPGPEEPLREDKAARLHQALRRTMPDTVGRAMRAAGRATAEELIRRQLSRRAQSKLIGAPWPLAAWLLGRWIRQNSWTFAGSGDVSVVAPLEFEIRNNPLIRNETSKVPLCDWHVAVFEHLFRNLVDPRLVCGELACSAAGAPGCRFALYLDEDIAPAG